MQQTFSIESLSKPIPSTSSVPEVLLPKKAFVLPNWMRVASSIVATGLVIVVG
jgi:hypothetical protein